MKRTLFLIAVLLTAVLLCGCSLLRSAQSLLATEAPTAEPTAVPTAEPTAVPTETPTEAPTEAPTEEPTEKPFGAEDLAGVWTMAALRYDGNEFTAEQLGIETYFEFRADGTVYCVQASDGDYDELTMAFDVNGYELTFHDRGTDVPGVYDPETDTITMTDADSTLIYRRDPDAKVPQKGAAQEEKPTDAPIDAQDGPVGEWKLTKAKVMGIEVTAEDMGQNMSFRIKADGSAEMFDGSETTEGLSWTFDGETLTVSAYGEELFGFVYDGTVLTLPWSADGTDVDLVFERTGN